MANKIELAQAYVTIIPSMKGSKTTIEEMFSGIGEEAKRQGDRSGNDFTNGFSARVTALKTMVFKGVSAAMDTVSQAMGTAIERLDIIKAYPKTMQALGYSANEAQASINAMTKHLVGLPTSTADMVSFVKSIAASGVPLKKATTLGLAFNDMLLAGGASSEEASRAMLQYNQMLAMGRVDQQSWNSIASAVPGQLGLIAKQLLGASANQQDLYKALKSGTISMDEFNDAIIKCATEGGDGFTSFAEAAKDATGGIGTSLSNLKSRIANAMVEILDAIGQKNISNFLDDFSSKFAVIAEKVAPVLADIALKLLDVATALTPLMEYLPEITGAIIALKLAAGGIKLAYTIMQIGSMAEILGGLKTAFSGIIGIVGMAKTVFGGLFALIAANPFVALGLAIAAAVAGLIYFFTQTEEGRKIWSDFTQGLSQLFDDAVTTVKQAWEDFKGKFDEVVGNIQSGWNTATTAISDTWNKVTGDVKTAWDNAGNDINRKSSDIQSAWDKTCSDVKSKWDGAGSKLKEIGGSIGSFFKSHVPGDIGGAFRDAKSKAIEKLNALKDGAWRTVDRIKSFFTGARLRFPHIPLPHPRISGSFSLNPPRVPHFAIDWYAKGGVFDQPSVIGVGEAGREAVLPIDHIKPYFQEAAKDMPRNGTDDEAIIRWLDRNLGRIIYEYAPTATPREFARLINA